MSLLEHYLPIFRQILLIVGQPEEFKEYQPTRQHCIALYESANLQIQQMEIEKQQKLAAELAMVAWIDEQILSSTLAWRSVWQSEPLQLLYFNITIAGERVFEVMQQLAPTANEAREVFLFCLQHGFHGQFSTLDSQHKLQETIQEQRSYCLPESWQPWPNDEPPVSLLFKRGQLIAERLNTLLIATSSLLVVYIMLYLSIIYLVG